MRFLMQLLFCRAFHCNFLHPRAATSNPTCKLAAISVRFGRGGWGELVTLRLEKRATLLSFQNCAGNDVGCSGYRLTLCAIQLSVVFVFLYIRLLVTLF